MTKAIQTYCRRCEQCQLFKVNTQKLAGVYHPSKVLQTLWEQIHIDWNPHLVKHIHSIESIQRRATRLICGSVKSYSERLAELNWSTLELRRKYLCLVQLYKIIHGFSDVDYTRYIDLTGPTRTRRNHDFKIRPRAVRTNYFKFSFFNRYVNDWNSLPTLKSK